MLAVLDWMEREGGEAWGRGEFHKVYVDEAQDLTQVQPRSKRCPPIVLRAE
jgi:hypothetical protein